MIRGSLLVLLGLGSFVAVYIAMGPDEPNDAGVKSASLSESAAESSAPATTMSIDTPSKFGETPAITFELRPGADQQHEPAPTTLAAVRDVTPPGMTAGPKVSGPLERVVPPTPEPKARVERLFNPIVAGAGTIKVRGREIHLAGISAPGFDTRCGEGAAAWPCGRMARAALRSFIRGRAIECEVPKGAKQIPDPATCRVGGEDLAEWLVGQGWAKRSGDRYDAAEKAAREAKLGLWGDRRPVQAGAAASG